MESMDLIGSMVSPDLVLNQWNRSHGANFQIRNCDLAWNFSEQDFVRYRVSSLAGVLVQVGEGKLSPAAVKAILAAKTRTAAVPTAPASGLFLIKVFYR